MTTSFIGKRLIKTFEGYRSEAYLCPAGVWTIGWGHTSGVSSGDTCTEEQAEEWLSQDLKTAEKTVENTGLHLSQPEFDALVSLAYNIGAGSFNNSTLLELLRHDTKPRPEVERHWKEWRMADGVVLKGLERRRAAEYTLYSKGFFLMTAAVAIAVAVTVTITAILIRRKTNVR